MYKLKDSLSYKSLFSSSRQSLFSLKNRQKPLVIFEQLAESNLIDNTGLSETIINDSDLSKKRLQSISEYSQTKNNNLFNAESANTFKKSRLSLRAISKNSYFTNSFSKSITNRSTVEPISDNMFFSIPLENVLNEEDVIKDKFIYNLQENDNIQNKNLKNNICFTNNNYIPEVKQTNNNLTLNNSSFENELYVLKCRKRSSSLSDVESAKHVIETNLLNKTNKIGYSDDKCYRLSKTNLSVYTLIENSLMELTASTALAQNESIEVVVPRKNGITYRHVDLNDFKNSKDYLHQNAKELNNALQFSEGFYFLN